MQRITVYDERTIKVRLFIKHYIDEHGFSPSYRNIEAGTGIPLCAVAARVHVLRKAGIIQQSDEVHGRSIRFPKPTRKPAPTLDEQALPYLNKEHYIVWHGNYHTGAYTGFQVVRLEDRKVVAVIGVIQETN